MTLKKINERAELFKEYLKYRIDYIIENNFFSPYNVIKRYQMLGVIYLRTVEDRLLTFDEWLYFNKHEDLIL